MAASRAYRLYLPVRQAPARFLTPGEKNSGLPFLGATKGSPEASNQLVDLANGV
jgi:hypothetical protein